MTTIIVILLIWFILSMYKPSFEYIEESKILIMHYNKTKNNATTRKYIILADFKK